MSEAKCWKKECNGKVHAYVSVHRGYAYVFITDGYACETHLKELNAVADKRMGYKFAMKTIRNLNGKTNGVNHED